MNHKKKQGFFEKVFHEEARQNWHFPRLVNQFVKKNWNEAYLIGSFVYQSIARNLYGEALRVTTVDLLVENIPGQLRKPPGWEFDETESGTLIVVSPRLVAKVLTFSKLNSYDGRIAETGIQGFLHRTPLTIQSVAYDVHEKRIIMSDSGQRAISHKLVEVNDKLSAERYAGRKGLTVQGLLEIKKKQLQF